MFLSTFFTPGRIVFTIFFVIAFVSLMICSYKKDGDNHNRYYKNAGKNVLIYGGLILIVFVIVRLLAGH